MRLPHPLLRWHASSFALPCPAAAPGFNPQTHTTAMLLLTHNSLHRRTAPQSPFSIITDAAIAASTDEAGYGRKRVLASLGWGGEQMRWNVHG